MDVNLQLVREFFELNLFRVMTNWRQQPIAARAADASPQLFVENSEAVLPHEPPFVLGHADILAIDRAVVEVRAWHADRMYASVIEANPILADFTRLGVLALAQDLFGGKPCTTILVLSELPGSSEARARSITLLRKLGVAHVLEFPTVLQGLLDRIPESGDYPASQTLQTLRLLKKYRFIRNQQMEFGFLMEPPVPPTPPNVETVEPPPREDENGDG